MCSLVVVVVFYLVFAVQWQWGDAQVERRRAMLDRWWKMFQHTTKSSNARTSAAPQRLHAIMKKKNRKTVMYVIWLQHRLNILEIKAHTRTLAHTRKQHTDRLQLSSSSSSSDNLAQRHMQSTINFLLYGRIERWSEANAQYGFVHRPNRRNCTRV